MEFHFLKSCRHFRYLETCRIKAGQRGDTGTTWPSSNPSEGFDQILAGQQAWIGQIVLFLF